MSRNFTTTIRESSMELSARDRIKVKDISSSKSLDELVTPEKSFEFTPVGIVVLDVHNENSKSDKDYVKYVFVGDDGQRYNTGSQTLYNNYLDILEEMGDEPFAIECYKKPSKNYKDKYFLACTLV